jgi:putative tryptophan/tyrosine transport system substrate-binding protein
MRRRDFLALVGGAAATWPFSAYAQQSNRMHRLGVLMAATESDPEGQLRLATFREGLQQLGWMEGSNIQLDVRWGAGDVGRIQAYAKELVGKTPDVILSNGTPATAALQRETSTLPIIFAVVSDPVGDGFVASLAAPGGNITGFSTLDPEIGGKWLELLKGAVPRVERVAIVFNPMTAPGRGSYFVRPFYEVAARSFGVQPITAPVHDVGEIEGSIAALGREPGGGLIIGADTFNTRHRELIIKLAAHHQLSAVYPFPSFAREGGLMAYGPNATQLFRRAAAYVDRVLHGAKPANLPVQVPTKLDLVINLKTARAINLEIPSSFLARADEVIE